MAFSFGGFDFDSNFGLSGMPKTLIGTKDPALIQGTKVEALKGVQAWIWRQNCTRLAWLPFLVVALTLIPTVA